MDKREIPRNIDGRVKLGSITFINFLKILPFIILIFGIVLTYFNPITLFMGVVTIGILIFLFSEIKAKETGLDMIKDILRYKREGIIIYERSCTKIEENERFIENKIK